METRIDFRETLRAIEETELVAEARQLRAALEEVVAARSVLHKAGRKAEEAARVYEQARFDLLFRRWQEAGRGWCTACGHVVAKDELKLLYCAYRHLKTNWIDEKKLHTACSGCFDSRRQRSGGISSGEQFLAFEAREEGDGRISICSFGDWITLPERTEMKKFSYIPSEVGREWNIPPDIWFSGFGNSTLRVSYREVDLSPR